MANNINLQVYHGVEATVNAYIFSDNESVILVDCLRNSDEASKLAAQIKSLNKPLTHLFITHGHPDHYTGMHVMKQEFPDVQIVVNTPEIKEDIINFSTWMESVGWLEKEPALKPKTDANPNGFDYQANIDILKRGKLVLAEGAEIEAFSNYEAAECEHLTTLYSKDLKAFFANDFVYNGVHPWLAIDTQNIQNWKQQLEEFAHVLEQDLTIYGGHGKPGDISVFNTQLKYINDFEAVVAEAKSREEAMQKMQELYPDYTQADFLLVYSVNAFVAE
ncbi:MBL fold metallo-hydrolase [Mucilaginibacter auburnensis]|uniref:Glyoxylase-like metal-dependent hydrolase (Beta-lactamase superfamily II) n=1 Tax=Mucilaginibacter auburnensis TaxID=1457233 RepID=A0A2H9VW70_9SPHI|nr:MBL fold metallo-hydrolase [Mucilaginibacter auburnensis]PJJ85064.1 glyoxylase-like metal-dependent hydrolase (beta-lactamase superfamily II) [Mucilaginibacter auburnensis]